MDPTLLTKLISAVEATYNPVSTQQQRMEAYETCEEFKEKSPYCAQCGVLLAAREQPHIIRHFGLQLLEHSVKFRWYDMPTEDKIFIKENTMKLMAEGTQDILNEEAHIKDAVSRIVVEMMKREWPQQWPGLLEELNEVCQQGASQTELVLLVLLRVVEDVVAFKSVPAQRCKDMLAGLTQNMQNIFTFFLAKLTTHVDEYTKLTQTDPVAAKIHCHVAKVALSTLGGYVDWVAMPHIMHDNGRLLQVLCLLLHDDHLQLPAAECLLLITSRKGKPEDRKPLLILFSEDAMSTILSAATKAAALANGEHHYLFLKRLCQVLTSLGNHLTSLWTTENPERPINFEQYLAAILAFTGHPSQVLGSYTYTLFSSFMRHDIISKDPVFQSIVPRIFELSKVSLTKIGFPSQNNSTSCDYARLDFDSDEDFSYFFSRLRSEVAMIVRLATQLQPSTAFTCAATLLQASLQKPVPPMEEGNNCNLSSPVYLEWDALSIFLESVMGQIQYLGVASEHAQQGIQLFKDTLAYDTEDPLILSCVLSCVSALFLYINDCPEMLPVVLQKIFNAAQFTIKGQTKATRSKGVKNVRRHACSCLVKICKTHPNLLLPGFEQLSQHIKQLSQDPDQLSQMEKCTLMEALILISNKFYNYHKQSDFLGEVLQPVKELWLSDVLKESLWNVDKFISYVGVDQAPVEPSDADTCGINRSHISLCLSTILAIIKRSECPADNTLARSGGFMVTQPDGKEYLRNPAFPNIGQLFDNVLALCRTVNSIWSPEYLQKRHPEFLKAYDLNEAEKLTILGIPPPYLDNTDSTGNKNPVERMQNFFTTTHENCCHILGNMGSTFGQEFYATPNLATSLVQSTLFSLEHIPDYRLRPIIRVFIKPYIQFCPKELYPNAVIPLLTALCPYILHRLTQSWNRHNAQNIADIEDENPEAQEVLDDQLLRLLTRDFLDLLYHVLLSKRGPQHNTPGEEHQDAAANGEMDGGNDNNTAPAPPGGGGGNKAEQKLSELGILVLETGELLPSVVLSAFSGLTWNDSQGCLKCAQYAWPILKLIIERQLAGEGETTHLFTCILLGLQQHGHHEAHQAILLTLAMQAYSLIRPLYPDITSVMLQIPTCTKEKLESYDNFFIANAKPMPEKKRKDAFKKLILDIIGKDIGQQFKNKIEIKELPPMLRKGRAKRASLDESDGSLGLCALFSSKTNDAPIGNHMNFEGFK